MIWKTYIKDDGTRAANSIESDAGYVITRTNGIFHCYAGRTRNVIENGQRKQEMPIFLGSESTPEAAKAYCEIHFQAKRASAA